ncbi:MAG: SDR family NAD(P)-dependent oxidoreductase [Acidimicrobiia bacterium]
MKPVALVTGASAGLGHAFARALASRGYDLVLAARDEARLQELAQEVVSRAEAEVLTADLTEAGGLASVEARLRDRERPVDLLVNNAGFGTNGHFAELPLEVEDRQIRLNVLAVVRLAHAALEGMIERGRGGIINVSSLAAYQPLPENAAYGGSKAFVHSFSQALHEEARGTGVRVMVLAPGFTRTEFQERSGIDAAQVPGFLWQTAEAVVFPALDAFGRGRAVFVPGLHNQVAGALVQVTPDALTRRVAGVITRRY